MQSYQWAAISSLRRDRMVDAEKAVEEVTAQARESFYGWLRIGAGLAEMQAAAMELAYTNKPTGKGYNAAYKVVVERLPKLAKIDAATRSNAIWMHERREAIEAWHADLGNDSEKRLVNHPATIRRRYERDNKAPTDAAARPSSPAAKKDAEIVRLQEEVDAQAAEIRRLKRGSDNVSEGRDWTWTDEAEAIAKTWLRLYPSKAPQIASKVLELNKSTASRSTSKSTVRPKVARGVLI